MVKDFLRKFAEGQRSTRTTINGVLAGPDQVTKPRLTKGFGFIGSLLLVCLYALASVFTMTSPVVKIISGIIFIGVLYILIRGLRRP